MSDTKRYLLDCPLEIERHAMLAARAVVGSGYTEDYYASIASEFIFLYHAGLRDAKKKPMVRKVKGGAA